MSEEPQAKLSVRKLTARRAAQLIERFFEAQGPEKMKAAYGWDNAQSGTQFYRDEKFWSFSNSAGEVVGWANMFFSTKDPSDNEAHIMLGVFPAHERKGYRLMIFGWLARKAKSLGADMMTMTVSKANEAHYERSLREAASEDSPWIHSGDVWCPAPGYGHFLQFLDGRKKDESD
jgi:hypothetical protein